MNNAFTLVIIICVYFVFYACFYVYSSVLVLLMISIKILKIFYIT